jgi:hypothetical protein
MKGHFRNYKNWFWILGVGMLFLALLYQLFQVQQKLRSIHRQLQPNAAQKNNRH